jgi:hypothetical protein
VRFFTVMPNIHHYGISFKERTPGAEGSDHRLLKVDGKGTRTLTKWHAKMVKKAAGGFGPAMPSAEPFRALPSKAAQAKSSHLFQCLAGETAAGFYCSVAS